MLGAEYLHLYTAFIARLISILFIINKMAYRLLYPSKKPGLSGLVALKSTWHSKLLYAPELYKMILLIYKLALLACRRP